mgnify:CR=1 FL=1
MNTWAKSIQKSLHEWMDLAYNVHGASREYWTYNEITMFPIRNLLKWVAYLEPKLKEIRKRQEADQMKQDLTGQRQQFLTQQMSSVYKES